MRTEPIRLDLAGIAHNDVPDENGVRRKVLGSELPGWSGPPMSLELGKLVSRRGSALNALEVPARTVLVPGVVRAPSQAIAFAEYNRYSGEMPGLDAEADLVVYEDVPKVLRVRQADTPRVDLPEGAAFRFQLAVVALFPFKRGVTAKTLTLASGASGTLTNDGNAPAPVRITTTGSGVVTVRQDDTGQRLRTKVSVASGTVFDPFTRPHVRSGAGVQLLRVMENPSEWLAAAKKATTPFTNEGAAPVTLTIYDTYA